jgi:hypothetical protein
MEGLIDRIADLVLSVIGKKMNIALDSGRRREARVLIVLFLFIVFGMGIYIVYSVVKILVEK